VFYPKAIIHGKMIKLTKKSLNENILHVLVRLMHRSIAKGERGLTEPDLERHTNFETILRLSFVSCREPLEPGHGECPGDSLAVCYLI
jgi:hypothetical protein